MREERKKSVRTNKGGRDLSGVPHVGQDLSAWAQHLVQNAVPQEHPRAVASSAPPHAAQLGCPAAALRPLPCLLRPCGACDRPRTDSLDDMTEKITWWSCEKMEMKRGKRVKKRGKTQHNDAFSHSTQKKKEEKKKHKNPQHERRQSQRRTEGSLSRRGH